jgi:hypothetical protein
MKASWIRTSIGCVALSLAALSSARAEVVTAKPIGFDEVPAVLSPARATFKAYINRAGTEIKWELKYSGIATEVTQAHVHFGKEGTNGGIMLFACTNLGNGPADTQPCPKNAGTVTGTWTSASVLAVAAQGIEAGEDAIAQVIAAIRSNSAYFNIHSTRFPGGELRDQVN